MKRWWSARKLGSENPAERIATLQELAESHDIRVIPQLAAALDDRYPDVQRAAVDALASFGLDVIKPLLALHSKNFFLVAQKLDAAAIPVLLEQLENDDPLVREQVAGYLNGGEDRIGQLRKLGEKAIDSLAKAIYDSSEKVIWNAAYALSKVRLPACVPPLVEALGHSRTIVRIAVIDALGRLGDKRAIQPLWSLRDDADRRVAHDAAQTAAALAGTAFYEQIIELAGSSDNVYRGIAAE